LSKSENRFSSWLAAGKARGNKMEVLERVVQRTLLFVAVIVLGVAALVLGNTWKRGWKKFRRNE
jgi:hypothetical protein